MQQLLGLASSVVLNFQEKSNNWKIYLQIENWLVYKPPMALTPAMNIPASFAHDFVIADNKEYFPALFSVNIIYRECIGRFTSHLES